MEVALVSMIKKAQNNGNAVTKTTLRKMGKTIFNKLRALNIYDESGERLRLLRDLNEDEITTLLGNVSRKVRVTCPICFVDVGNAKDGLYKHCQEVHGPNKNNNADDEQMRSPPGGSGSGSGSGGKEFKFCASDGWVRNFCTR
ncbi:MAG: hypothetical protein AAGM46_28490, partial [Cyanobacteria bacterium J06582_2]